jgi:molybdenum cofactor guanylyltransferase
VLARTGAREIMLSARADQSWLPDEVTVVQDARPDAGPLAGIAAAMAKMRHSHLIVLAVDLPKMEPAWFIELMKQCAPGVGAVGRHEGYFEPLAAIYPRELLGAAETALAKGEYSLQQFIKSADVAMNVREITASEATWFTNWNEPE